MSLDFELLRQIQITQPARRQGKTANKTTAVCRCKAYPFPHRLKGGKCTGHGYICQDCGKPCKVHEIEVDEGTYEFWGATARKTNTYFYSDCCGGDVTLNE